MITISDIAAKAGVSRATVSYVLNERNTSVKISEATRTRVNEAAIELGYRRNELARAVTTGQNRMLGFWVMQSNREPVVRVLAGAMKEADENNYFIKMLGFDDNALSERVLERCLEWRLSGIIAIHAPDASLRDLYPKIEASGLPFITVDSQKPPQECLNIVADSASGMQTVVEHLVQLGHKRIAFLGGQSAKRDSISGEREVAYTLAMKAYGLGREVLIEHGDWSHEFNDWDSDQTVEAARRLLARKKCPTAVVCASDHIAMLMIRAAIESGLQIPRDLSVTGFDDVTAAALYNPALTTIAQPFEAMGRAAVRHLLQLSGEPFNALPVQIVVRNSTAVPCSV